MKNLKKRYSLLKTEDRKAVYFLLKVCVKVLNSNGTMVLLADRGGTGKLDVLCGGELRNVPAILQAAATIHALHFTTPDIKECH